MDNKYASWDAVPEHLVTKTQLNKLGLRPAKGQQPAAQKIGGYGPYDLWDKYEAVPKRQMTEAQQAALESARRQAALNSECAMCGLPFSYDQRRRYKNPGDTAKGAYICFMCRDRLDAAKWARQFLADPRNLILDTETTGLDDYDQIVEIAVIDVAGNVHLDTLVKPTISIPFDAELIHGIDNAAVSGAPSWADIDGRLFELLKGAPEVAIYNRSYDLRLINQTCHAHGFPLAKDYQTSAFAQLKITCAMEAYAEWYGAWSSYHKSYTWQPLDGGHRALGDCQATLARIRKMATEATDD